LQIRWLVHTADKRRALANACDRVAAFLMRGAWGPLLIGLPIALYFSGLTSGLNGSACPRAFSIVPSLSAMIAYGIPFALGWLLHRQMH